MSERKLISKNINIILLDYGLFIITSYFTKINIHLLLIVFSIPLITYFWFISNYKFTKLLVLQDEIIYGALSIVFVLFYMTYIEPVGYKTAFIFIFFKAFIEELYYRFCYISWFKQNVKQFKLLLFQMIWGVVLFVLTHSQYSTWDERLGLLVQGTIYTIAYFNFGLIPATLLHTYWNIYVKKYLVVFQVVLLIFLWISHRYVFKRIKNDVDPHAL